MSWKLSALVPARKERRHNAMGNLLADDSRGRQFTYNAMGRMAEARQGASVLRRYTYNAWGEQVQKATREDAEGPRYRWID